MTSGPTSPGIWDRIGISLSGLCMVHCMLLPVVLIAVPLWSTVETLHDWLHPLFLVALLLISFMALVATSDKPTPKSVRVLLGVGLLVIVLASLFGHQEGGADPRNCCHSAGQRHARRRALAQWTDLPRLCTLTEQ